jgi:hypothetical protein
MRFGLSASVIAALALVPVMGSAQAVPRTVVGVVRDSAGRPLENAVVALNPNTDVRATRADAQGRFRFDRIDPGEYALRVTWLGYVPVDRTVTVPREGLQIEIVLARLPFQLDTLRVVAQRKGVFGTTVQRSDFRALGGVNVDVLGTRFRSKTEADGKFAFDLREGSYVIVGRRDGFASRILPVPVPSEEAVEVALALDTARTKAELIVNNRLQDMQMRWRRSSTMNSAIVGRHELASSGKMSLDMALRYAPSFLHKAFIWEGVECIYIDGLPQPNMRAKDYSADQIAMVEVYVGPGGSSATDMDMFRKNGTECGIGPTDVGGDGRLRVARRARPGTVSIVHIWLKK